MDDLTARILVALETEPLDLAGICKAVETFRGDFRVLDSINILINTDLVKPDGGGGYELVKKVDK